MPCSSWGGQQPSWPTAPTQPACSFPCRASLQHCHGGQGAWGLPPPISVPGTASARGINSSFLPNVAKTEETCRNGARYLTFLQFGITRTHIHITAVIESSCHMLLFLTLLCTHRPEEGHKLTPQTREFPHVSKRGFKNTSGKSEKPAKRNTKQSQILYVLPQVHLFLL